MDWEGWPQSVRRRGAHYILGYVPGCICCWVMDGKHFDENETTWFESIHDSLRDCFTFFLADVVKDRYCDNGVVKIGRELYGSDVSNFTVDSVQAL